MAADTTVEHKRSTVRPDKADAVAELAEAFRTSSAAVLTEYRGMTVKQITALRVALGADTTYSVVKNTLTTLAARDAGLDGMDELLSGPTAVAFVKGDPVEAAKSLRDFGRANPALVVKGGVMDGRPLTADEVRRLADLESREVLLARLAGALLASLSGAAALFNAPLAQVARLAGALQSKAEEDPTVLRGGAGTTSLSDGAADSTADGAADPAGGTAAEPATADESPADATAVDATAADVTAAGGADGAADSTGAGAPAATAAEGVTPAQTDTAQTDTAQTDTGGPATS